MDRHTTTVCEHGRQINTCRCPAEDKEIVVSDRCPFGCDSSATALSFRQMFVLRRFTATEAMDDLPREVQSALRLLVRQDANERDAVNATLREILEISSSSQTTAEAPDGRS